MVRPAAKELTGRELEIMHCFWAAGALTAQEVRERLAEAGPDLAYTTVATLVRILADKGFLQATNAERPIRFAAKRGYEEVSRRMLGEVVERLFRGSRAALMLRLTEGRRLTKEERATLERILLEKAK